VPVFSSTLCILLLHESYLWAIETQYKALRGLAAVQALLRCGWTTLRVAGDSDVHFAALDLRRAIDGAPHHNQVKKERKPIVSHFPSKEGLHVGPRLTGAGHYLSITGGGGDINTLAPEHCGLHSDGKIVDGPDEMRKAVRQEIKYGSDWIKVLTAQTVCRRNKIALIEHSFFFTKLLVTGAYMAMSVRSTDAPLHVHFSPEELKVAVEEARRFGKHVMAHAHSAEGIKEAVMPHMVEGEIKLVIFLFVLVR